MAHFALVCPGEAGHFLPMSAVGHELVRRGHRVTVVARADPVSFAQQVNLPFQPLSPAGIPYPSAYYAWRTFELFHAGWVIGFQHTLLWDTEIVLQRLPQILQELAVDGLLVDQIVPAGGSVAEHAGLPFVTVCSALLWNEEAGVPPLFTPWAWHPGRLSRLRNRLGYASWNRILRPIVTSINRYRTKWKLPPLKSIEDTFSPLAQISQLCSEFDFPRRELPSHFHYVGALAADRPELMADSFPWSRLNGRPLIFASLGTITSRVNASVYQRILEGCAGLDAQLVLSLGRWSHDVQAGFESFENRPSDSILVDYAPQLALLDRAAVLITHAGVNTVLESLTRGVPMLAMPRNADHPGMGARIERSGVGLLAPIHRTTAEEIRQLVLRVLTESKFRAQARTMQQALIDAGGANRAADLAEEALLTRRTVRRAKERGGLNWSPSATETES